MSAVQRFIKSARKLHAEEADPAKRWEKMTPLLQELLADPSVREESRHWPDCSQGGERAENLLFYEDADYKFVINGLIKAPHTRTEFSGCQANLIDVTDEVNAMGGSTSRQFSVGSLEVQLKLRLKTTKQIGLTMPQWTLMKATKVIQ